MLAVLFWATSATAFKIALSYVSPYVLLFYSSLFSTFIFITVLTIQKKIHLLAKYKKRDFLHVAILGLLNPFGYYVIMFKAYDILPGQIAMSLNYSWPIVLSILSIPILKQTVSIKQLVSIVISFVGVVIIATKGEFISLEGLNFLGIVLALVSTVVWAIFWLVNAKDKHDPVIKLFWGFCFGVLYTLILSPFFGPIYLPPAKAFFAIIYISFFEMGITFIIWLMALKLATNTAKISNMIFIAPFISLLILNLVLNEELYVTTFIGLVLIIAGIVFQGMKKKGSYKSP